MADETQVQAEAAAEAPAKIVEAIADTAEKVVTESKKVAKRTRATTARPTLRSRPSFSTQTSSYPANACAPPAPRFDPGSDARRL